jgi:hypothetical protein
MSATNFTPIQLYRTSTAAAVPTSGNLAAGELAINLTDEALYFKNAGGVVTLLADSSGALGSVTSVAVSGGTTGLTTSGGPITSSGTITLAGTLGVANGGTGTATAFTSGSVVFAGASGVYTQDNANLFWDNTNDRLGIGNATPSYKLEVTGDVRLGGGGDLRISSASGTTTPTGDSQIFNDANNMIFTTGTTAAERMRIDSSGNVGIGTTSTGSRLTVSGTVNFTGALTSGDLADAVGYKGLPQNAQTSTYTLALADQGKHVFATSAAFTITIPTNASVAFPVGTEITIFVGDAVKTLAPAGGVTLILGGTALTGNRTLAINSVATCIKLQTDTWVVSGAGVT